MEQGYKMTCYFPVGVYDRHRVLKYRPCGGCVGCRLDYSRQWAIRCMHESMMHEDNCFVTLTYNNDHLPEDGNIDKGEIQKFIKNLRKENYPKKIRYFSCGEYGAKFSRPHYHLALFGIDFDDKEMFEIDQTRWKKKYGKPSNILYRSDSLENVWKKGFSSIGDLTFESAGYVARYVTKKITGKKAPEHYSGRVPEFALMSRMPGIGKEFIEKYWNDVYPKDFVTMGGVKMRPPRYYDSFMEKNYPKEFEEIKKRREDRLVEHLEKNPELRGEGYRQYCRMRYRELITNALERRAESGDT